MIQPEYIRTANLLFAFLLFVIGLLVFSYVISAISYYRLAKTNGYDDKAFYAWIPFLNIYLLGILAGEYEEANISCKTLSLILICASFLNFVPVLNYLIAIPLIVINFMIIISLYRRMGIKSPQIMAILSVFVPFLKLVYVFTKRNTVFFDNNECFDTY